MSEEEIEEIVKDFEIQVGEIYLGNKEKIKGVINRAKDLASGYISLEDFKRKLHMNFLKESLLLIKNEQLNHGDFLLEELKKKEFWNPLAKLILFKRIEELCKCKVLRKGKKYDDSGLRRTFIGKYIMNRLNFERRSVLTEDEYLKITNVIKKLNYDLPVVIQLGG
ncbi:MAG: hypothetical protein ACTSXH_07015 [Promethearchaeota archaeon]